MQKYKYVLKFEDPQNPFKEDGHGVPMAEMLELLVALLKTVDPKHKDDIVLNNIIHESHGPEMVVKSLKVQTHLKVIHKKIRENDLSGFDADELSYAARLKKTLKDRLILFAYDPADNDREEISDIVLPKVPQVYFQTVSIRGVLTSIGSKSLSDKVRSTIRVEGFGFDIKVSASQEMQLIKYYKNQQLRFVITKRIDFATKETKDAELESFTPLKKQTFADIAAEIKAENPDGFFNNIEDTAEFMRKLRSLDDEYN